VANSLLVRLQALPWAAKEGFAMLLDTVTGAPERKQAALAYVKAHATAGNPASVLAALDDFGRNRRFLMNIGDEKGPLLEKYIHQAGTHPRMLELGGYVGYSAILFSQMMGRSGQLVSIELNPQAVNVAQQMVEFAGLSGQVDILQGDSHELIPQLSGHFDLVFLDHWKNLYTRDLQLIESNQLLKPGSTIIADNCGPLFNPDVYLNYVRNHSLYTSTYISAHLEYQTIEDGVEVSTWQGS